MDQIYVQFTEGGNYIVHSVDGMTVFDAAVEAIRDADARRVSFFHGEGDDSQMYTLVGGALTS